MFNQDESQTEFEWGLKHSGLWDEYVQCSKRLFKEYGALLGKAECLKILYVQFTDAEVMKHRFDEPLRAKRKDKE